MTYSNVNICIYIYIYIYSLIKLYIYIYMKLVHNEVNKQVKTRVTIHCVELSTVPTCQLKFVQSFGRTMTFLRGDTER